jgi:hypothetical protein
MKWLALFLALLASPCWAQPSQMPLLGVGGAATSTYTGPGDIVTGATAWYGLRAYNAAYATGSNNAINVRRASDNSSENIVILSTGKLDIATANSFAGTDATCTGTISTTTLSCTGASSTPHVGSTVTGAGVTQPCYITAVGSFTSGTGTVTVAGGSGSSPCGTVSSGVTMTMQYGLYITEWYDQSGAKSCASSTACNLLQSTAAQQPQLFPNCGNSLPCIYGNGSYLLLTNNNLNSTAQPFTESSVAEQTGSSANTDISTDVSHVSLGFTGSSSNQIFIYAGVAGSKATQTSGALHAIQVIFNGASTVMNVDNTTTTVSPGTNAIGSAALKLFGGSDGDMIGYQMEFGIWPSGFSSTQQTNICHNQRIYWGSSGSC